MQLITKFRGRVPGYADKMDIAFYYNPEDGCYWRKNGDGDAFCDLRAVDLQAIPADKQFTTHWGAALVRHAKSLQQGA